MKQLIIILTFFSITNVIFSQELNTSEAIDSVYRKIHWKKVKKIRLGRGLQNWYLKDKNSDKNYWYRFNHDEEVTEFFYYNDQLVLIKQHSKSLPDDKEPNLSTFFICRGEVIDTFVRGRRVSATPLLELAEQNKSEARAIIFQNSEYKQ